MAMFAMLFVAMMAIAFVNVSGIEQQIATNHIYDVRATYLADAGVETAVYELRQDSSYLGTGGSVVFPSGSGQTYSALVAGGSIAATGIIGDFQRSVTAEYTLSGSSAPYTVRLDNWVEQ